MKTEDTFNDARVAYNLAKAAVVDADAVLGQAKRDADNAFYAMKAVCPHAEGFSWNGFGGHNDVTHTCNVCGTSKSDAKKAVAS